MNKPEKGKPKIGIFYIATRKYNVFWPGFKESADKLLFPDGDKHYFFFTDSGAESSDDVTVIPIEHKPWPEIVLGRFGTILKEYDKWKDMDYVIYFNSNSVLISELLVSDVFSTTRPLTACAHAVGGAFCTYSHTAQETNPESTAYIPGPSIYVQSALQGGMPEWVRAAYRTMDINIRRDAERGITARWHDESHWNKFVDWHKDIVKYLGWPTTCTFKHPFAKVLLLDKDAYFNVNDFKKGGEL